MSRSDAVRAAATCPPACSTAFPYAPRTIDVLDGGTQTTVQDYPGAPRLLGRRACRRRGRWTTSPSAWPTGCSATPRAPPALEITADRADAACSTSDAVVALTGAEHARRRSTAQPIAAVSGPFAVARRAASCALGAADGRGRARLPGGARRARRARTTSAAASTFTLGGFGGHGGRALRAGDVLRLGDAGTAPAAAPAASPTSAAAELTPSSWDDRRALRPARRAGLLHPGGHRDLLRHRLEGALQLQPHRRAPDRPQARVGARGRRRGRPAPLEHPRQRLRHRRGRLHRRHADHPRPRRPEPGRLRLPGRRSSQADLWKMGQLKAGRHGALPPRDAGPRRPRWREQGPALRRWPSRHAAPADRAPRTRSAARRAGPARRSSIAPDGAASPPRGLPPRRRRLPAGRVRPARAGPRAALARPRADGRRWQRAAPARHHRPHAGHPLAAGPLRRRDAARERACWTRWRAPRSDLPAADEHRGAHRASSTCRCPGTTRRRCSAIEKYMQVGAQGRALVPEQHRVHPPHQRPGQRRRRASASSSTPATWCWAWATSTSARRSPRRSTRATAWSPPSTTPPAPGRRRTRSASAARTCASTAWRARAATSSSAAPCRCGTRYRQTRRLRRRQALAAALLRPDPLLSGQRRGAADDARATFRSARVRGADRGGHVPLPRLPPLPGEQRDRASPPSRRASRRRSTPSASAGRPPARTWWPALEERSRPRRAEAVLPAGCEVVAAPWAATSGRCWSSRASRRRRRGHRHRRGDEDRDQRHQLECWRGPRDSRRARCGGAARADSRGRSGSLTRFHSPVSLSPVSVTGLGGAGPELPLGPRPQLPGRLKISARTT